MTTRTVKSIVTFTRPFRIDGFAEALPAGSYAVESDEELLEGVSFPVWRRMATYLRLPPMPGRPGVVQTLTVDGDALAGALAQDRASATQQHDLERASEATSRVL